MSILIKNVKIIDEHNPQGSLVNLYIQGNIISQIIPAGENIELPSANTVIDGRDKLAIPGFVNTHTHVSMTLLRSYADDMKLMDWLNNKIWPIEAKMTPEDIYWGAMLGIVEMIRTGTTSFADMYGDMDKVAQAVADTKMRAVLARGIIGVAPNGRAALEENVELFKNFHGTNNDRIRVMFGPHAPYTCPPDFLRTVVAKATDLQANIHIHLAETLDEIEACQRDYGKSPFEIMEETGVLNCGVLAAHCVHLSDKDIELMARYHVRVAHNPTSNMKLASGVAPIGKLLAAGISVGLGTDGTSSNNNLDMLEEIKMAAILHKVHNLDPLSIPAHLAYEMGTSMGAKVLGYDNLGVLEEGKLADIVLLDTTGTKWQPCHNIESLLVYSANSSSVDTVIVDGNILMQNQELKGIDEERIIFEANNIVARLVN